MTTADFKKQFKAHAPEYVPEWEEYAAWSSLNGLIVYGDTHSACQARLEENDRVAVKHLRTAAAHLLADLQGSADR